MYPKISHFMVNRIKNLVVLPGFWRRVDVNVLEKHAASIWDFRFPPPNSSEDGGFNNVPSFSMLTADWTTEVRSAAGANTFSGPCVYTASEAPCLLVNGHRGSFIREQGVDAAWRRTLAARLAPRSRTCGATPPQLLGGEYLRRTYFYGANKMLCSCQTWLLWEYNGTEYQLSHALNERVQHLRKPSPNCGLRGQSNVVHRLNTNSGARTSEDGSEFAA
jgi:hypothetical protein